MLFSNNRLLLHSLLCCEAVRSAILATASLASCFSSNVALPLTPVRQYQWCDICMVRRILIPCFYRRRVADRSCDRLIASLSKWLFNITFSSSCVTRNVTRDAIISDFTSCNLFWESEPARQNIKHLNAERACPSELTASSVSIWAPISTR